MVNIVQVICIVASVVMLLDSINLLTNKSKKLVESSMKFRIFCNSSINSSMISSIIGVVGFSSLWSIHEIIEQEERVKKGWFPNNPNKSRKSKH
jgi:hypothetical protein